MLIQYIEYARFICASSSVSITFNYHLCPSVNRSLCQFRAKLGPSIRSFGRYKRNKCDIDTHRLFHRSHCQQTITSPQPSTRNVCLPLEYSYSILVTIFIIYLIILTLKHSIRLNVFSLQCGDQLNTFHDGFEHETKGNEQQAAVQSNFYRNTFIAESIAKSVCQNDHEIN